MLLYHAFCRRELAGAGIVISPTFIAGAAVREGKLRPVLSEWALRPLSLYAVFPSSRHLAPKVRVCVDYLVDYFGGSPAWDTGLSD